MSGQLQTIWETLGIEPTADKRAIRHAYACKCRECHPEDHPEEFRLLHQSYEQALDWADKKKEPHTPKRGGENESFSHGQGDKLLRDGGEREKASESSLSPECWDKQLRDGGEREEASENTLSPECWDELLRDEDEGEKTSERTHSPECRGEQMRAGGEDKQASERVLSPKRWDELLERGMEENASFPVSPDPFSWQQVDRTQFSAAALTGLEELLEQMKLLESFCRDHPPQDDSDWKQLMERWDLLGYSRLFRQLGENPCYFQMLFDWLNAERGRLHIPTIIGLLRIYQMKKRIIGHPWRARRYEKKIPELRRITYEFIFYQSIWDAELFLEKFNMYGLRGKKKARSELRMKKEV